MAGCETGAKRTDRHTERYAAPQGRYTATWMPLFFVCAVIGWSWEVLYCLIDTGELVNRGFLHGPWLPIYGVGGVLILIALWPLHNRPALLFSGAVLICGALEYGVSWALELAFHARYWDYSDFPLNLHGRICPAGLVIFGASALILHYLAAPWLDRRWRRVPAKLRRVALIFLVAALSLDILYSCFHPNAGAGITTAMQSNP